VWRCERPVLLTDTARISQLEPGPRDAVLSVYASYSRTVDATDRPTRDAPTGA